MSGDLFGFDPVMPWPLQTTSRDLTATEAGIAAEHINSRTSAAHDACQVCSHRHVVIQPALFSIALPEHLQSAEGALGYAHIMTICYNCGFTRLFNATVLGLTPTPLGEAEPVEREPAHG